MLKSYQAIYENGHVIWRSRLPEVNSEAHYCDYSARKGYKMEKLAQYQKIM